MTPTMNAGGVPSAAPIPIPGSYGLPVLGRVFDTLDFLFVSGWTEFFARRQRKYRSDVFKVNLFRPTIVLLDHPAISRLSSPSIWCRTTASAGPYRRGRWSVCRAEHFRGWRRA